MADHQYPFPCPEFFSSPPVYCHSGCSTRRFFLFSQCSKLVAEWGSFESQGFSSSEVHKVPLVLGIAHIMSMRQNLV